MTLVKRFAVTRPLWAFALIWGGQLVSLAGTGLTNFALGVWVYQRTGSVTQFALISFSASLPGIFLLPLAGALIDRWDRRWAMMLSDTGAALGTLTIWLLLTAGQLEIWHIYLISAFHSACGSFQLPAYTSATTMLVPQKHLGRASGMIQIELALAEILAPVLAGVLMVTIGLEGIVLIDLGTFSFAVLTLLLARVPRLQATAAGLEGKGSLLREAVYGWTYIKARPGLLSLLLFFAVSNLTTGMVMVLIVPLVLSFSTVPMLGTVSSIASGGMLLGGLTMSVWGGPHRRVHGVLGFSLLCGIALLLGGLHPSAALIASAAALYVFSTQLVNGCSQALWQSKVALDVQGRVFAMRRMIALSTMPLARLAAGPLVDHLFEPWLVIGGPLAGSVGRIIGAGPGRGIGFLFIVLGVFRVTTTIGAYVYRRLRQVEDELPDVLGDHSASAARPTAAGAE